MSPERLLKHFEQICEAPDAVQRLRRFILDLAVRGKLIEQNAKEEPVGLLVAQIQAERAWRAKIGEPTNPEASVESAKGKFLIPPSWKWVRLGFATNVIMGQSPPGVTYNTHREGMPLINGPVEFTEGAFGITVLNQYTTAPTKRCKKGDLLLCVRGSTTGRTNVAGFDACIGRGVASLQSLYADKFIRLFVWASREQIIEMGRGIAFPSVSRQQIEDFPTPLPPLAEQHRIVAKVEELMALCDKLEAAQAKREKRRDRLVAATLHGLNNGDASPAPGSRPTFKESARFYLNHLPRFTTRPEHIHQLRQTILNLAVRGRLVPQDLNDEPTSELLQRIDNEKSKLLRKGKIKQISVTAPVTNDEIPFEIPKTWRWVRVSEVAHCRLGKMLDKAKNKGAFRRYLRNLNVRWFDFDLSDLLEMRFEEAELEEFSLRKGDVLICEGGEPGRAAIWDGRDTDVYFQKAVHRVRFFGSIVPTYFVRCLYQDAISGRLTQFFTGVGIKHFTGKGLARYTFPLPPLPEQHRITEKVDQMMALCDELEAGIATTTTTRFKLFEAALQEALALWCGPQKYLYPGAGEARGET